MKMAASDVKINKRFKDRFHGRISHVNKEGDYGVAASTRLPI